MPCHRRALTASCLRILVVILVQVRTAEIPRFGGYGILWATQTCSAVLGHDTYEHKRRISENSADKHTLLRHYFTEKCKILLTCLNHRQRFDCCLFSMDELENNQAFRKQIEAKSTKRRATNMRICLLTHVMCSAYIFLSNVIFHVSPLL